MSIIGQGARIAHHTVTLTGLTGTTFTVPTNEDFTIPNSWTIYDLALSEIGVDEDRNKAYIRIGSRINEFSFGGSSVRPSGRVQLTGGTAVVPYSGTSSDTNILLSIQAISGGLPAGIPYIGTRDPGVQFEINSTDPTDAYYVCWEVIN